MTSSRKPRPKNRRTVVRFPVFSSFEVRVIVTGDVAASGRRLQAETSDAAGAFITDPAEPCVSWLLLPHNPDPALVAHEASHAVRALFAFAGVGDDEEAFAYHLGHLVRRIHKFAAKRAK